MSTLAYVLAVDVGTSRTAASTARAAQDGGVTSAAFGLGRSTDSAPSAIFISDGDLLFGEAAERRGLAQPGRLVREFKRRIGDDVPIVVGDQRFAPEDLYARMVAWVVEAVAEREGGQPSAISVTTPVTWGDYRSKLIATALAREISTPVELITEPEAAARHYETTSPLGPGRAIAVYDLGGGTFDVVILRKEADGGLRLVGAPSGIADFGGADFDDIVLRHVIAAAGLSAAELNRDPASRVGLASLRRECVEAKEALSFDSEAVVPVLLGQSQTTVRITRAEFEGMIEDGIERTIEVMGNALDAAGMQSTDLEAILLTGGSSRIPRIAQLLSERFDRPIAIDADPKAIVALGAARDLVDRRDGGAAAAAAALLIAGTALPAVGAPLLVGDAASAATDVPPTPAPAPAPHPAQEAAKRKWFGRLPVTAAIAGGAMVLAGGMVLAGASGLGSGLRSSAQPSAELMTDWLAFSLAGSEAAAAEPAAQAAPPAVAPVVAPPAETTPSLKAPAKHVTKPSSTTETARSTTTTKTEEARPSRIPAAETPRPEPTNQPPANPAPDPSDPSDPTDPPVDPSDPPVDPSDPPTDPTDPPVDPTDPPVDPTDPPVDPTDPPTDPTDPPVDPTDPPVDPTDPPVEPTDPPAEGLE